MSRRSPGLTQNSRTLLAALGKESLTTYALASLTGRTPASVNENLLRLFLRGLVDRSPVARTGKRGRPVNLWSLKVDNSFPAD